MTQPKYVLIGPPGAGKTTVGKALARELGLSRRDTDVDVERAAGKMVADIFIEDGEAQFRRLERQIVHEALQEHDGVLSLGGGAIMDPDTQEDLREYVANGGHVVFLEVSLHAAAPRVGLNNARPLLATNPRQQWAALMEQRLPIYQELATITVSTDHLDAARVASEIVEKS